MVYYSNPCVGGQIAAFRDWRLSLTPTLCTLPWSKPAEPRAVPSWVGIFFVGKPPAVGGGHGIFGRLEPIQTPCTWLRCKELLNSKDIIFGVGGECIGSK